MEEDEEAVADAVDPCLVVEVLACVVDGDCEADITPSGVWRGSAELGSLVTERVGCAMMMLPAFVALGRITVTDS